jgi:hypothetical protein
MLHIYCKMSSKDGNSRVSYLVKIRVPINYLLSDVLKFLDYFNRLYY